MKQQKVSFEIAKAIKNYGYPQDISTPTYLDVWLWMSEEKNIYISPKHDFNDNNENVWTNGWTTDTYKDPQSAIIAAVEYIVTNNYFYDNK